MSEVFFRDCLNNIFCGIGRENEIFTDITSVFLGFGKLMLNGCEVEKAETQIDNSGIPYDAKVLKSGYLNQDQLAFAYRLVCIMREIWQIGQRKGLLCQTF